MTLFISEVVDKFLLTLMSLILGHSGPLLTGRNQTVLAVNGSTGSSDSDTVDG